MKTVIALIISMALTASTAFSAPVSFKGSPSSGDTLKVGMEYTLYSTPSGKQELRNAVTWSYSGLVTVSNGVGFQMQWANYVNKSKSKELHENEPKNGASNMIFYSFPEANCKEGSLFTGVVETIEASSVDDLGSNIQVTPLTGHICSIQITSVAVLVLAKEVVATTPTLLGGSTTTTTTSSTSTTSTGLPCVGWSPGLTCANGVAVGGTTTARQYAYPTSISIGAVAIASEYYVSIGTTSTIPIGTKSTTVNTKSGSSIPLVGGNTDYKNYLLWLYGITPNIAGIQPGTPEYVIVNNNGSSEYTMVNAPQVIAPTSNGTGIYIRGTGVGTFTLNIDGSVTLN